MATSAPKGPRYGFGPFELDTTEGRLYKNGTRVPLQDLPYRLLALLVERANDIVTREELKTHLWPGNTFVEFDNSLGVAIRKVRDGLNDVAESPRYVETIPKRGYRFLGPVSLIGPHLLSASAARESLSGAADWAEVVPATRSVMGYRRPFFWLMALLIMLCVSATTYFVRKGKRLAPPKAIASPPKIRQSVALLGFRNLRGRQEDKWLSAAFVEMLSTELAAGGEFRLVSGEDISRAKSELPLTDEDTLATSTLRRLRMDPGADLVVLGSYTPVAGKSGNRVRLDVRVQDTQSGETVAEDSITGNESDLFQIVAEEGGRLRSALGVSALSPQSANAVRISLPANREALRFYSEGRTRAWAFDFAGSRSLLLKAIAADPNYALSHAALSESWERLGYSAKALAEAQTAVGLSQQLPEEERLRIEGQYFETAHETARAVETFRRLFQRFPDNLEYGLRLVAAQRRISPADALVTLSTLRKLPAPAGDDPRIDMAEASTLVNSDVNGAHTAIQHAITKGTTQGSHLLVARAYGILCQLSLVSQSVAEEVNACENARQSYAAAGDRDNEARTLNDFAGLYFQHGDMDRAEAMWREAAPVFQQVGDEEGVSTVANNLGGVSLLKGNLADAKTFLKEAAFSSQRLNDKDGVARALNDIGDTLRRAGDLQAAATTYEQAKATADEIDDRDVQAFVQSGLGDVALDRGDLAAARKHYEEALRIRNALGEKQMIQESDLSNARLAEAEGHSSEAEIAARACRDEFRRQQQVDDELDGSTVLIIALTEQGKTAEAHKEAEQAQSLAAKTPNLLLRLQLQLATARVSLAMKQIEQAQKELNLVIAEARRHGLVGTELEARLGLAKAAKAAGRNSAADAQFLNLQEVARAKGYESIARLSH